MELRNRATGAVVSETQFRAEFPNTSFPKVLTPEIIDDFGYDSVLQGPRAEVTGPYQYSQRDGVEEVNGQWFTKNVVGPNFEDYQDDDGSTVTAAQQEADYRARVDASVAAAVRSKRNGRLSDSDWTQLSDAPVDAASWATYRQDLRDITSQAGFPHDITWPAEPA